MYRPNSITLDALGNIFFSDSKYSRIRKITASTGIITTVVGNGRSNYSINSNGKDATVSICSPLGIAVDTAGSIYLCQWNAVRKVTYSEPSPSSFMTGAPSVAPASSITVSPTAVTPLPLPSLLPTFIPTPVTSLGIISTVAGSGAYATGRQVYDIAATGAKIYDPRSVAVDAAGNFFITTGDDLVLKVTAGTGLITVVGGTGKSGFSGDKAAATAATFDSPRGIALDQLGNIYVAD